MKIYSIKNLSRFLETIKVCKNDVYLITDEGDRLNLKSKLCSLVALDKLFNAETNIGEINIEANPKDLMKLVEFLVTE